jgi:hypothetical protein
VLSSLVTLDHRVFLDNTNGYPGGASAVRAYGTNLQVTHCTFVGNRSTFIRTMPSEALANS